MNVACGHPKQHQLRPPGTNQAYAAARPHGQNPEDNAHAIPSSLAKVWQNIVASR